MSWSTAARSYSICKKKKRGQRAAGGDKNGRGLRQFSMKVCEKVESKGRTTYNEQQYDEKNIRRRVYDALNVLMAMDIISKDKKEIQWKGLPRTSLNDIEELKTERLGLGSRIEKKAVYLQELEEQYVGLQNLIQRNEQLYCSGDAPSGGVSLPFILVQESISMEPPISLKNLSACSSLASKRKHQQMGGWYRIEKAIPNNNLTGCALK
ncbi:transcription factor-like protein DPB isoform X1 [Rosa rugosa]|uniref:transcription factor-like protein DPB isoform X1 n=1 Tax=Rosa rugosa TaxID=74645 RepID=UPI002B41818A|nr:transcription factor-like protein DPB isoform X1 [Rosa rugosa]XP_062001119.1 transcription factor-like protein DPB isoform X1 [Rosa rugosa]XP_062001120.1 transcription factor-like protein DPB isoform X1 [Rosa rugosa]XP_062001121.1 transcription factor-like protein DPB isoform X1 [Rosa rugosa]XP_062001122.1 transcription factor-like protein DPB isoform X1 [Rosa rugosa]XP_062001123.1 transcription factor-like protein DPB isoform X1 [Rosa rugosa]XP_062001124.1 transcription factor-like protei